MVSKRRKSRLPTSIQEELLRHFVAGASARSASELCGVNRNTAILFFHKLREIITDNLAAEAPDMMDGEIEVDESHFGSVRKGKRGRGAAGKVPVFGLLKRGGRVYAVTIQNARTETLLPIIESKIQPDSIVYTDSFRNHDVLDVSDFHHVRINHSQIFAEDNNHISPINSRSPLKDATGCLGKNLLSLAIKSVRSLAFEFPALSSNTQNSRMQTLPWTMPSINMLIWHRQNFQFVQSRARCHGLPASPMM